MKVEVAVLGFRALILNLIVVSLDVKHREKSPYMNVIRTASDDRVRCSQGFKVFPQGARKQSYIHTIRSLQAST